MKRYNIEDIDRIRELRKNYRYSLAELSRQTGIPNTTIGHWCRGDSVQTKWDTLRATNERKRLVYKISEINVIEKIKGIDSDLAKLLVALLYWCEGSKYPASNSLTISNSDSQLLFTYILLLRKAFELDEKRFHIHVQIHTYHDFRKVKQYWSKLLNIPETQFIRPTITRAKGKKHRNNYHGTCTLKYQDYRLQLKIIGIYEEFADKIRNLIKHN